MHLNPCRPRPQIRSWQNAQKALCEAIDVKRYITFGTSHASIGEYREMEVAFEALRGEINNVLYQLVELLKKPKRNCRTLT